MSVAAPAEIPAPGDTVGPQVTRVASLGLRGLSALFGSYGLAVVPVADGAPIPGSYWGDTEAGLVGNELHLRDDTPVHSALHEGGHYLCMDAARRTSLHTDARSDDLEEVGVCYLQVLLADRLPGYSRERLFADMDAWGYSFRLGSARTWFEQDSEDAKAWLVLRGII